MNRHSGSQQASQGGSHNAQHRSQPTYNAMPIPQGNGASRARNGSLAGGQQQYDMAKSPPNHLSNKSTYMAKGQRQRAKC